MSVRRNSRGDTIIEVMFAMAIIGVILAAAYATASKNLQTSQMAKERTQAAEIAESQLEQLKALDTEPTLASFCLDITQATAEIDSANPSCTEGFYSKAITKTNNQYKVVVEWVPPGGSDTNKANVTLYYTDYDFATTGNANVSIAQISSGVLGTAIVRVSIVNESSVLESGVLYSTTVTSPVIGGTGVTAVPDNSNSFQTTLTGLSKNTVYYVRGYARTTNGYIYSKTIVVNGTLPPVIFASVSTNSESHAISTATVTGEVTADNGSKVTQTGVVYAQTTGPTLNSRVAISNGAVGNGIGPFTANITNLLPNTTYYVRAFATNADNKTAYGNELTFTTNSITIVNPGGQPPYTLQPGGTFNGHTYYYSTQTATWDAAAAIAQNAGGHLVTISNAAENAFVSSMVTQTSWLGLTDNKKEGEWTWVTGEPYILANTSWSPGEPNDYKWTPAGQDYALMNWAGTGSGLWDDQAPDALHRFVIEFEY